MIFRGICISGHYGLAADCTVGLQKQNLSAGAQGWESRLHCLCLLLPLSYAVTLAKPLNLLVFVWPFGKCLSPFQVKQVEISDALLTVQYCAGWTIWQGWVPV